MLTIRLVIRSFLAGLLLSGLAAPAAPIAAAQSASIPAGWSSAWPKTDFSQASVPFQSILSGGPPKDGIPPIDEPRFESVKKSAGWLADEEPVLVYDHNGDARAYPLQILIWHEIVNDTVGGRPVVITFCPLCNSALVFDRRVGERVLDFGTTGKLRKSDLVMWDRQTESWWQQLTGEAIVGSLTGTQLTYLPAPLVSFGTFRESHPGGKVLSQETGHYRNYGGNPYVGYDDPDNTQPFLLRERANPRLPTMERVVAIELEGTTKAYPYRELAKAGAVNDRVGGRDLVIVHALGTRSALDQSSIRNSRDVGTGVVFDRTVDGRTLTFDLDDGHLVDKETGTRWNLLGQGVSGKLKGMRLKTVVAANHFAFAWLAFRPDSEIYQAP